MDVQEEQKREIAGLNRKISELQEELRGYKEPDPLKEREKALNAREKALRLEELCNSEGLPMDLIVAAAKIHEAEKLTPEVKEHFLEVVNKVKDDALDEFKRERASRAYTPKGADTNPGYPMNREQLLSMSDEQINRLPQRIVSKAMGELYE
jgi:hypothetical protein